MLLKLVTPASFFQELSALAAKLGRWAVHVIPRNFKSKQSGSSKILPLSLTSPLHRLCPLAFATATSSLPIPQQRQRGIQPGHVLPGRIANIVASVARQQRRSPAAVHLRSAPHTQAFFAGAVSVIDLSAFGAAGAIWIAFLIRST
jgi:hypothetical protein